MARALAMPVPEYIGISEGAANDLTVLRTILPHLHDTDLYGDKIYADNALVEQLEREQQVRLYTPVKKAKRTRAPVAYRSSAIHPGQSYPPAD